MHVLLVLTTKDHSDLKWNAADIFILKMKAEYRKPAVPQWDRAG